MTDQLIERAGVPVLLCDPQGPVIATERDVVDIIGNALAQAEVVAIPAQRLDEKFFLLRTGFAGEVMQKFVNYRLPLAVVGDISAHLAGSGALRDLVRESNRGKHIWFVNDLAELDSRLGNP